MAACSERRGPEKLERGAKIADVGCGYGGSTVLMAKAFPKSPFVGFDFHPTLHRSGPAHAETHGVSATTRTFEVGASQDFPGPDYDLLTFFDCLHDMGDPAGAGAHIRQPLEPPGLHVVEPMAGDALEHNLNPVGRLFYAGSTMICLPTSLSQEVGAGLGAQAGEKKLSEVIKSGGFKSKVKRATETPFNMILEARP